MGSRPGSTYFDSAATSFPKSPSVYRRIRECLAAGGTYGRSLYPRVVRASRMVERARELVAQRLGVSDPRRVSFAASATAALNGVILGHEYRHRRVLVSPLEHNAVGRPLRYLMGRVGLVVETLPCLADGTIDLESITPQLVRECDLVVLCHASNVSGVVQPLADLRARIGDAPLLVDACQSAGHVGIEAEGWGVDWLACSGHKGLGGVAGVGCLYASGRLPLRPLLYGGTGMDAGDLEMPTEGPARYEAGTPNLVGIAGLLGALEDPIPPGHDWDDYLWLLGEIRGVPGLRTLSPAQPAPGVELCSVVPEGRSLAELALELTQRWGMEVRSGLHCSWLAHSFYGTAPHGSLRISLSPSHVRGDLERLAHALRACMER